MEYTFGQLLLTCIGGVIAGGMLVYFIMRERVEWPSEVPLDDPKRMNFTNIDALPSEFPPSGPHIPDYVYDPEMARERDEQLERLNEERRIYNESEKQTLDKHIKSLLKGGYVLVDDKPLRFAFCLSEGDTQPHADMYYYTYDANGYQSECVAIHIDDQRRITSPPDWYEMINDCYKLVDGIQSLCYALSMVSGVEDEAIERPLRLVFHDDGYLPVIKVYKDMSWFDDLRWQGPVIVTGSNGQAMGIVPTHKPGEVHLIMEEVVANALPFMDAMSCDHEAHMALSKSIAELHAAIKEAGCHAKEVQETGEGV